MYTMYTYTCIYIFASCVRQPYVCRWTLTHTARRAVLHPTVPYRCTPFRVVLYMNPGMAVSRTKYNIYSALTFLWRSVCSAGPAYLLIRRVGLLVVHCT